MRVIDARSGEQFDVSSWSITVFSPPKVIRHTQKEGMLIYEIEPGLVRSRARVTIIQNGEATFTGWVPIQVRWTHPLYFGRRVAFIPS